MKVVLMSTPMMTQEGTYFLSKVSEQEYIHIVQTAKEVIALMGYPSCSLTDQKITGLDIKVTGNIVHLVDGDIGVICGRNFGIGGRNFEYYRVEYTLGPLVI